MEIFKPPVWQNGSDHMSVFTGRIPVADGNQGRRQNPLWGNLHRWLLDSDCCPLCQVKKKKNKKKTLSNRFLISETMKLDNRGYDKVE